MLLLKKKRYQEQLLDKTENQISNLERMVSQARGLFQGGNPWNPAEFHSSWQVLAAVQPSVQGQMSPKLFVCHDFPPETQRGVFGMCRFPAKCVFWKLLECYSQWGRCTGEGLPGLVSALSFQSWMCLGLGSSGRGLAAGKSGGITWRAAGPAGAARAELFVWICCCWCH